MPKKQRSKTGREIKPVQMSDTQRQQALAEKFKHDYEQRYEINLSGSQEINNTIDHAITEGVTDRELRQVVGRIARTKARKAGTLKPGESEPVKVAERVAHLRKVEAPKIAREVVEKYLEEHPERRMRPKTEIAAKSGEPAKKIPRTAKESRPPEVAKRAEGREQEEKTGLTTKQMYKQAITFNELMRMENAKYLKEEKKLRDKYGKHADKKGLHGEAAASFKKELDSLKKKHVAKINELKAKRDRAAEKYVRAAASELGMKPQEEKGYVQVNLFTATQGLGGSLGVVGHLPKGKNGTSPLKAVDAGFNAAINIDTFDRTLFAIERKRQTEGGWA